MLSDILLSALAFASVVIGVFGEARALKNGKLWQAINRWGWAAILVGLLVCLASIAKSHRDSIEKEKLLDAVSAVKASVQQEASRLQPADLKMLLTFQYRLPPEGEFPDSLWITGAIGSATFFADFQYLPGS